MSTCKGCKLLQVCILVHIGQCVLCLEGREICEASHGLNVLLRDCKASLGTEHQRPQLDEVTQGLRQIQPQQLCIAVPPAGNSELLHFTTGSKVAPLSAVGREAQHPVIAILGDVPTGHLDSHGPFHFMASNSLQGTVIGSCGRSKGSHDGGSAPVRCLDRVACGARKAVWAALDPQAPLSSS